MAPRPKMRGSKSKPRKIKTLPNRRAGRKTPPRAAISQSTRVVHGETLTDDYAWLRDPNWRDVMRDPLEAR